MWQGLHVSRLSRMVKNGYIELVEEDILVEERFKPRSICEKV